MAILTATLTKMLELFLFILIGYVMKKKEFLPDQTGIVLSKLENNLLMPALIIHTFVIRCTWENLVSKSELIIAETIVVIICCMCAFLVSKLLATGAYMERIYRYALVVPNFAFMGNAVVEGVLGEEMLYNYMILTIPLNIFAYTIGIMWLMPGEKVESGKSIINPIFIALIIGAVLGITQIPIPAFIMNTVENAGRCMAPVAMIFTGFIIGNYKIKEMLYNVNTYVLTILRLLIIPILAGIIMDITGVDEGIKTLIICTLAMPFGLNTIIITAAYGGDTRTGAGLALVSHVLGVITIPVLMTMLLN